MRPVVVLPLVLVAIVALLAVLLTGSPETNTGPAAVDVEEEADEPTDESTGPVTLVTDGDADATDGSKAGATSRERIDAGVVQAAEDSPDNVARLVVNVLDPDGRAIENASLSLAKRPPGSELAAMLGNASLGLEDSDASGRTRGDGAFTFQDLEPSPYYALTVRHADFAETTLKNVSISAGKIKTVTVTLEEGLMVHGYIRDEGGRAMKGAQLVIMPIAALNMTVAQQIEMGKSTKSNEDGYYSFKNVDLNVLNTISAHKAGYGRQAKTDLRVEGADETVEADFRLVPGLSIRGMVRSANGDPIEGAKVDAYGFVSIQNSRGAAVTKADGTFELLDLVDGPYQIRAHAPGWADVREPRVDAGEQNLVLELQPLGEVSGTVVVAANEAPVSDFTLGVRRVNPGTEVMGPPFLRKEFKRRADGSFSLKGVPEGVYVLEAEAAGFAPSQSTSFEVRLGQVVSGLEVRMSTGGGITGRIVDAATGEPIAGAKIFTQDNGYIDNPLSKMFGAMLSRSTTSRSSISDEEGRFTLGQLMPTDYQLRIEHPDFTTLIVRDLDVGESEEPLDYGDFQLETGGSITGTVYDENGVALANATVAMAHLDNPGLSYQTSTDSDGQYSLDHLATGRYQIHAQRNVQGTANPFEVLLDVQNSQSEVYIENGVEQVFDLDLAR